MTKPLHCNGQLQWQVNILDGVGDSEVDLMVGEGGAG